MRVCLGDLKQSNSAAERAGRVRIANESTGVQADRAAIQRRDMRNSSVAAHRARLLWFVLLLFAAIAVASMLYWKIVNRGTFTELYGASQRHRQN